jgi:outer membrane protein assembly factor BamB
MDSAWPMKCHDLRHTGRSPYSTADNPLVEKWRFYTDGWVCGGSVIDNDGIIYFGDFDGYLNALYSDGSLKWKIFVNGWVWSTPALGSDSTIYVSSFGSANVWAINPDGSEKWRAAVYGATASSPAIADDGTIYSAGMGPDNKGSIVAINPDGTEKWRYETGYRITSDPAIGSDGTVYCGSGDSYFYALYPDGSLRWRFNTGDVIKGDPSIADDGIIYISSLDGYLYALNTDGSEKWKYKGGQDVAGPAIGVDGTIYLGNDKLRAINPDGSEKWSVDLGPNIDASSPCISADGTIFVGDVGEIVAVNPDGSVKWRKGIGNQYVDSSPCIGEDGTVYIGSSSDKEYEPGRWRSTGYLHAFGPQDGNTAPNPPSINAPSYGKVRDTIVFWFSAIDPNNNPVSFYVDWGDETSSGWTQLYASEESFFLEHTWSTKGSYTVRVKAKDTLGEESEWSEHTIGIKIKAKTVSIPLYSLLLRLIEQFPIIARLFNP